VYTNAALSGLGVDEYREDFGSLDVLRFRYLYVGLPGLDGVQYLQQGDEVSAALLSLMRVPLEELKVAAAEAGRRIAASPRSDQEKYLLMEMLEAYLQFPTEEEELEYRQLIATREEYREVYEMAVTTYERGVEQGREEGREQGREQGIEQERNQALQRQREMTAAMIERRFGQLPEQMRARLDRLSFDELSDLCLRFADAQSLDDLQLS
jgi:flagellar biosynthesis/type III secretory pathway protein FliH